MSAPGPALERSYRRLLRCYPASWRRHREEEVLAVLLDQAEAAGRDRPSVRSAADVVTHGLEARLDAAVGRLPRRLREQLAMMALVVGAGLSLILLAGEVQGARSRPPAAEIAYFSYFHSGPFLSIGVGLYLAFLSAALLCVLGRPGLGRALTVLGTLYATVLLSLAGLSGVAQPRLPLVAMLLLLGIQASVATLDPTVRVRRRLGTYGAGFFTFVAALLLGTKPVLGWSVGTASSSGNVALVMLAAALTATVAVGLPLAGFVDRRHPGWLTAALVTALPLLLYCTVVDRIAAGPGAGKELVIPAGYAVVVLAVWANYRRRRPVADS